MRYFANKQKRAKSSSPASHFLATDKYIDLNSKAQNHKWVGKKKNRVKHHLKPYQNINISCALKNTDDEHHLFSGAGYSYRL